MAPPLAKNLPKVTQYVKNLGKSVQYATVDYFKGTMSDTSEFVETNQELFREITHAAKNYRRTLAAADRSIKQSKIYEAGSELRKTLFDSIRTGKFYDPKREEEYEAKASGSMGDMSDMDDWSFNNDQFDIDSGDISTEDSTNLLSSAVKDAATAQAGVIARSSEYLAEINKSSTKLLFTQGEKMYATVSSGLAGTQSMLQNIRDFLTGPLTTHMENSRNFYQEVTPLIREMNANLKEISEMQRNMYKRQQEQIKETNLGAIGISSPDLREYAKNIKKNFMEVLGPEAQMLLGNDAGDGNMLLAMVANPLKFIPEFMVKSIVPATIKKSLETLDASFSNLFANFIARMNKAAKDDSSAGLIMQYLGKIFGIKLDKKTSMDTSKYEKGAVPFDGITRKTIVDIIPGHLSRIEAALTGKNERVFDYETGKWTTADKLERDFKERRTRNIRDAAFDVSEDVRAYIAELRKVNEETAKSFEEKYDALLEKIYEDSGAFEPYKIHGTGDNKMTAAEYYGFDDEQEFRRIARMMIGTANGKNADKRKAAQSMAAKMMRAYEDESRRMREAEINGYSTMRYLYNNSYNYSTAGRTPSGKNGTGLSNIINDATDKYNKNVFFYLRGIYAELTAIRSSFGDNSSRRRGRSPKGPTPTNPLTNLETILQNEIDTAAIANATSSNSSGGQYSSKAEVDALWDDKMDARDAEAELADPRNNKKNKGFLSQLLEASSLGAKFKVITSNLNELTKKPGLAIAGLLDTADKRIFQMVFGSKEGEQVTDSEGRTAKGFLDYMILRTRESFDKLNDWIDENFLKPLKEKLGVDSFADLFKILADRTGLSKVWGSAKEQVKKWSRPTIDRLKSKFGWGWNQFKGSMSRTYGAGFNTLQGMMGGAAQTVGMSGSPDETAPDFIEDENGQLRMFASGSRLITKRGLAIVSPGERIIPNRGKLTQRQQLNEERAFARRRGLSDRISMFAAGTAPSVTAADDVEKAKELTKKVMGEVMGDTKHKGVANVIASSLIGGGASLLTGMIGGPLLGAAVGAAFGITQNSGTLQKMLFGEDVVDENGQTSHKEGFISKDIQDKVKKYLPSMRDFGLAGAVAGLFTPFGLVGGLMAGSAIGFAKENDSFQTWLFGEKDDKGNRDGGLLKKEFRDKLKKAAPRMLTGVLGGVILGPFGLLGNAALGSALGFATTTDKFHEIVFGKDDGTGKKKGGMVQALYRGIIKPFVKLGTEIYTGTKEFIKKKVIKPLTDFGPAFLQMMKNGVTSVADSVKDHMSKMLDKTIGRPLADFLEHTIFDNVRKWAGRLLKAPLALAKGVISAPFAALGFVGNNIRSSQIAKGTASDMTAQQRLDWRSQHKFRMFGKEVVGHDKFKDLDKTLAGMQGREGIERMKTLRDQLKIYEDTRGEMGRQTAELVRQAGEIVSDFFNGNMVPDHPDVSIYTASGSGPIKKIHQCIAKGDLAGVDKVCSSLVKKGRMSEEQRSEFIKSISTIVDKIAEFIAKRQSASKYQKELQAKLSLRTGGTLSNTKNIRRFRRMLDSEIESREVEEAKNAAEGNQTEDDGLPKLIDTKTSTIIDILSEINENLAMARMTPAERKKYLRKKNKNANAAAGATSGGDVTTPLDDMITGSAKEAASILNRSYHTIETDDGSQALADSKGNIINSSSASKVKRNLAEQEQDKKDERTWREKLNDSLFGKAVGTITSILGGAKNGLFGLLGGVLNKFSPVIDILKWVFIGGTAIAATGHASGWLKETVFPWLKNTVGPWLIGTRNEDGVLVGGLRGLLFGNKNVDTGKYEDGLLSGISNWFIETPIAKFFSGLYDEYKESGGLKGLVGKIFGWYVDGFGKFAENIAEPLAYGIVKALPSLIGGIAKGVWKGIKSWFSGEEPTGDVVENSDGSFSVSYSATSNPSNYTASKTTGSKSTLDKATESLGLTTRTTNVLARDNETGELLWTNDETGQGAFRVDNGDGTYTYVYEDGTVEQDPNASFSLAKYSNYANRANSKTTAGTILSGFATNILNTATGLNAGAKSLPKFGSKGILKNLKNMVTPNFLKGTANATAAATKTGWNIVADAASGGSSIGTKIKEGIYKTLGKEVPEQKEGILSKLKSKIGSLFSSGADDAATAAAGSVDDVVGAAASTAAGAADDVAGAAAKSSSGILSKIKSAASSLLSKVTGSADDVASAAASGASNAADDVAKTGIKGVFSKLASAAGDAVADQKNTLLKGITEFCSGIFNNSTVQSLIKGAAKILGTSIDDIVFSKIGTTLGEKLAQKIGNNIAASALKSAVNALATIPIATIVLAVGYFVSGWNDAHNVFGIAKDIDIPITYHLASGSVNAIKNCIPGAGIILAFIPTDFIISIFTDYIFPMLGWDNSSLKKMQEESQKLLDEYNASVGADEQVSSVEEYNEKVHPGLLSKIKNAAAALGSGVADVAKTVGGSVVNAAKSVGSGVADVAKSVGSGLANAGRSVVNFIFGGDDGSETEELGGSKRGIKGVVGRARHLYQGDPSLSGIRFGNSTIGDAGCGPVAATNLMNRMSGGMDLGTAANMAIPYQTSDGGITPDYFTNVFNRSGIGGKQTDNKEKLLKSVENGQPAVLLGKSGSEKGTPFGANDHYITALGTDGRGNMIVEDPDLPESTSIYPISKVMNDTVTGVMTGYARRRANRMGRFGKKRRRGFERTLGDTGTSTQQISNIAIKAYDIIHQYEGNYNSVNKDDNGSMSIGKIQWHGPRAYDLLKKIISASGSSTSSSMLGTTLYNEIMTVDRTDWNDRKATGSEATAIGKFISTDIGKQIQDTQGYLDIQAYVDSAKSLGLTDENAIIFYCDMYNQSPKAAIRVAKNAISSAGSGSAVTLDIIYKVSLTDSTFKNYTTRRTKVYNDLKDSASVGSGYTTLSSSAMNTYNTGYDATYGGNSGTVISNQMTAFGNKLAEKMFGSNMVNAINYTSQFGENGSNGFTSTGDYSGAFTSAYGNGYGTTGSSTQQGVVDKMASIIGKIKYSLDWDKQDPDKGYASCASTVGWAYRKALGVDGMSASSTTQSQDSRFTTIWTADGKNLVDPNILQPGDVMYFNWDQRKNTGDMQHTEMYAGNNQDLSHGGNPEMGPVYKDLDTRTKNLMMVRRYNGFLTGDASGSRRRRGYARAMTNGVSASISENAKKIISQYGINTNSNTPGYTGSGTITSTSDSNYQQFLSVIIDLLAAIADNTTGLAELQKSLASSGINIDSSKIERAAANARRHAARARAAQTNKVNSIGSQAFMNSVDVEAMADSPTGYIVQIMESLASE